MNDEGVGMGDVEVGDVFSTEGRALSKNFSYSTDGTIKGCPHAWSTQYPLTPVNTIQVNPLPDNEWGTDRFLMGSLIC